MNAQDVATPQETIEWLLDRSQRPGLVPIRKAFLQTGGSGSIQPGPLRGLVANNDEFSLDLYLLALAAASHEPWEVTHAAEFWARTQGLPWSPSIAGRISKAWRRLDQTHHLIGRRRGGRQASTFTVLREDGTGEPYGKHPGKAPREAYFQVPFAWWTATNKDGKHWHRALSVRAKGLLLIALDLGRRGEDFRLPYERVADWYGLSAETAQKGLEELCRAGLLKRRIRRRKAPGAPHGFTEQWHYTLQPPFKPPFTPSRPVRRRRTAAAADPPESAT